MSFRFALVRHHFRTVGFLFCFLAATSWVDGADEVLPILVFPPLSGARSWTNSIWGVLAPGGKQCLAIQRHAVRERTGWRRFHELKVIDVASGNDRVLMSLDAEIDGDLIGITRDGQHAYARIAPFQWVFLRTTDFEVVRRIDMGHLRKEVDDDNCYANWSSAVPDDLSSLITLGAMESENALCRVSLADSPEVVSVLKKKNSFLLVSTIKMVKDGPDGRFVAVVIPRRHQHRSWKLLLLDLDLKKLAEMDVPVGTAVADAQSNGIAMVLLISGTRWTLMSIENDTFRVMRTGVEDWLETSERGGMGMYGTISPDSRWLVTVRVKHVSSRIMRNSHMSVWRTTTGELVRRVPLAGVGLRSHFDATGTYLSCTIVGDDNEKRLYVWDFKALVEDDSPRNEPSLNDPRFQIRGLQQNGPMNERGRVERRRGGTRPKARGGTNR